MGHHKRRRPKKQRGYRAGRWMCKPWKQNGVNRSEGHRQSLVADLDEREQLASAGEET